VLYFSLSLLLSLILSGSLLVGLIKSLQLNWSRKNRRPVSFLAPVLLTLVFLAFTLHLTVPRLLDMVTMVSKTYAVETVHVDARDIGWSTLSDDGRVFYYNQWRYHPAAGKTYQIQYTPRSLFIVYFTEVPDLAGGEP
jgi:hypothetical protein